MIQGDSGSELVCEGCRVRYLTGLVSFRHGSVQAEFSGVNVREARYLTWIRDQGL